jgi:hypothetical protein
VKPIRLPLRDGIASPIKEYKAAKKIPAPMPVLEKINMSVQYSKEKPPEIILMDIIVAPIDIVTFFPILSEILPPKITITAIENKNAVSKPPALVSVRLYSVITSGIITPKEKRNMARIK